MTKLVNHLACGQTPHPPHPTFFGMGSCEDDPCSDTGKMSEIKEKRGYHFIAMRRRIVLLGVLQHCYHPKRSPRRCSLQCLHIKVRIVQYKVPIPMPVDVCTSNTEDKTTALKEVVSSRETHLSSHSTTNVSPCMPTPPLRPWHTERGGAKQNLQGTFEELGNGHSGRLTSCVLFYIS